MNKELKNKELESVTGGIDIPNLKEAGRQLLFLLEGIYLSE